MFAVAALLIAASHAETVLKDAFEGRFSLGAAIAAPVWEGGDERARSTLLAHFNSITAENEMKLCARRAAALKVEEAESASPEGKRAKFTGFELKSIPATGL